VQLFSVGYIVLLNAYCKDRIAEGPVSCPTLICHSELFRQECVLHIFLFNTAAEFAVRKVSVTIIVDLFFEVPVPVV
jgi:hypothetical protein